jgi:hypothetical protein
VAAADASARKIDVWSLTSLQQRLVKTRGRLLKHAATTADGGREPSGAAAGCRDGAKDRRLAGADGSTEAMGRSEIRRRGEGRRGVSECTGRQGGPVFGFPTRRNLRSAGAKGSEGKNCCSEDRRKVNGCIVTKAWDARMEIRENCSGLARLLPYVSAIQT